MKASVVTAFLLALHQVSLPSEEASRPSDPAIRVQGKWVLDADGKPVPPGSFTRGLQPSGLLFRKGELWSIGDQRSEYPGHLLRIDPATARLIGKPIRLALPEPPAGDREFEAYRDIPNPDFEAICADPKNPDAFLAVTEDKIPWIVEIHLEAGTGSGEPRARITRLARIRIPDTFSSWRDDPNYRFEGIAVPDDRSTVWLAFERSRDDLPRVCRVSLDFTKMPLTPEEVPFPFASIPRRADKPRALLNINDILFLRRNASPCLLAVLRDQERLLLLDLERRDFGPRVDLDLLDPTGAPIQWVSPEGLAVDEATDRLWIINDPDSVGPNYRARAASDPTGKFASYTPLLFELKLSAVLGPDRSPADRPGGGGKAGQ